jgi:hypothetical protein
MPSSESRRPAVPTRDLRPMVLTAIGGIMVALVVILLVSKLTRGSGPVASVESAPRPVEPVPARVPAPTPVAPTVAPAPPPPPPPVKPATIDVLIRVSPSVATIAIDDHVVDGNPFSKQYAHDTETHHIRASAPGYVAKSVAVGFNANVTLDMSLERVAPPPTPPAPPPRQVVQRRPPEPQRRVEPPRPAEPPRPTEPPAETKPQAEIKPPPAPSSPEIDPRGGSKPRRPIDPNNPYGEKEKP